MGTSISSSSGYTIDTSIDIIKDGESDFDLNVHLDDNLKICTNADYSTNAATDDNYIDDNIDDDDDDNNFDERIDVIKTMKILEQITYPSPICQELPEIFRGAWRKQIVEWMYVLVKYCKLKHEATAAAVYYLDTAVSLSMVQTPKDYQLCAMTALHVALKVYGSPTVRVVKLSCLVKLGNGKFIENDIIQMEYDLLRALKWRLHPPTPDCFLHRYLELLPLSQNQNYRKKVEEITEEIIEVAVANDRFLAFPSSVIAYAALLLALELTTRSTTNHRINASQADQTRTVIHRLQQSTEEEQYCDFDWSTFLNNMKSVAGMSDVFENNSVINDKFNCNNTDDDNRIIVSQMVHQTKMLLDRIIIQGRPLEDDGDENDDDDGIYTTSSCDYNGRNNNSCSGEDEHANKLSSSSAKKVSFAPPSPTSTLSSNTLTTATTTAAVLINSPPL